MKSLKMLKLGLILSAYCLVGCVALAAVYSVTSKVIAQRQEDDLNAGLREVFPAADSFVPTTKVKSPSEQIMFEQAFTANVGSKVQGIAIKVKGPSYGGPTTLLVGVSSNGTVTGVKILENNDTPGLGANAANPTYYVDKTTKTTFAGQFTGKKLTDPFEVKNDVIAITSATITSRSITGLVQAVGKAAGEALGIGQSTAVQPIDLVPGSDQARMAAMSAVSANPDVKILETWAVTREGIVIGAVAKAEGRGYEGTITGYVGVSRDGTITGVSLIASGDTPGLGDQVLKRSFTDQFTGMKASDPITVGKGVTAITGATYSSTGAAALVKAAAGALEKVLAGGEL